jgi:hypothetical protein
MSPFFSKKAVSSAEPAIREQVEQLCRILKQRHDEEDIVTLKTTYLAFTTDTLCSLAFYGSMGLQEDRKRAEDWMETMLCVARLTPTIKQFSWIMPFATRVPLKTIEVLSPVLARLLHLHKVQRASLRTCIVLTITRTCTSKPRGISKKLLLLPPPRMRRSHPSPACSVPCIIARCRHMKRLWNVWARKVSHS